MEIDVKGGLRYSDCEIYNYELSNQTLAIVEINKLKRGEFISG